MRTLPVSSPAKYGPQLLLVPTRGRVLVTGGAGYLGAALVRRLLAKNYKVRVLDPLLYGSDSLAALREHPRFELAIGDIRDASLLEKAARGCHTVLHLAAIVGDSACERHSRLARDVNVSGTHLLLNACRRQEVRRFIFASTCSVYGISPDVVNESSAVNPVSHYAETKVAAERLVHGAASRRLQTTVLRLPTLFGVSPRPRFDLLVNLLTARAFCEGKIRILNGTQWRPFAHVSDVARAFEQCMEADPNGVSGQVFNVGDRQLNLQLSGVSEAIQQLIPHVEVIHQESGDARSYRPSFQRIRASLGFCCNKMIEDGIMEVHDLLKSNEGCRFNDARYWNDRGLEQWASVSSVPGAGPEKAGAQGARWSGHRAAACGT